MITMIGSLWMIVAAIGFALMGYFVKLCSQFLDYQEIVFWRMAFCTVVLFLIAIAKGDSIKTVHFKGHVLRGIIGTIALLLYFYTMTRLPLATAVTLSYTSVIWFIIFSFFILKQRVSLLVLLCSMIGLIGVVLLLQPTFSQGQLANTLIGFLTGAVSGLAYIQVRELTMWKEPEWRIVFYFSLIGAIVTGVWSMISGMHALTLENFGFVLAMSVCALVGQMCMTLAYAKGDLFISSIFSYFTIVFSFLIGFFVLGETVVYKKEIFGVLLIISSGVVSTFLNQRRVKF